MITTVSYVPSTHNGSTSVGGDSPTPNDVIESLTGRRHLSWSQLSSFRGCPRRWHFSHVEGLLPEFVSSALLLGSAVHTAVQHHYEQRLQGQPTTLDQLRQVFNQAWHDEADQVDVRYSKDDDCDTVKDTGARMLEAFLSSDLATPSGDLIAIEETLVGSVHPDLPDLMARIDVVWQTNDGVHLMDLKTSRSRWSASNVNESSDQLLIYQQLAGELSAQQQLHLHFGVITKAKSPVVQLLDVPPAPPPEGGSRADDVISVMLPVWNAMKLGVDFASPSPMSCSTCGYQSHCPAYRAG